MKSKVFLTSLILTSFTFNSAMAFDLGKIKPVNPLDNNSSTYQTVVNQPSYELKELNNLFIELTSKNCNQRCKNCYINLPQSTKTVKDFISTDRIKSALNDVKYENLHCIYHSFCQFRQYILW